MPKPLNGEKRFSNKSFGKTGYPHAKNEVETLPPYRKVDSKWTKSLNIRMTTTKLSKENIGKKRFFFKTKNIKKEKK